MYQKNRVLAQSAMIAALYVVLTFVSNFFGLASGAIQLRISEALTILPFFSPAAVPGLFLGCLLANVLTGCALLDVIFGGLATLLGALGTYFLRRWKWLAPIPPIAANTLIVPFVLMWAYGVREAWWYLALTVGVGELLSAGVMGMLLLFALQKQRGLRP